MADLKSLIKQGEGISLEFKTCRRALNRDIYETICAFLNRHGGTLLLGVNDFGEVTGVDPDCVEQIKKDFVTAINNPQKVNPPCYLSVDDIQIDSQSVLHIFVPESSQVHRCNGRIYDRNEDGDLDITDHTVQVANLYQRKQVTFSENKVYPRIGVKDLRADLIDLCRKITRVNTPDHPWATMDDQQLIQSAQLHQTDPLTGKSGVTLAGILLLGGDQLILSVAPAHRTDLILRKVNIDRYDDRDLVRTNLIDSYDRILAFIHKHLPDPFYLDGIERVSLRDIIFREVASNMLIHREYTNGAPSRLIIEYGQVSTENPNRPHGFGPLNLANFAPFPKNPVIGAFFREIYRADELGSGMRKMMRYGKTYGGADPQLIEGDLFRMIIKVPEFGSQENVTPDVTGEVTRQVPDKYPTSTRQVTPKEAAVLTTARNPSTRTELQKSAGFRDREHFVNTCLNSLLKAGFLEMTIPDKPRSSKQKYRLTDAGKHLLSSMQEA